MHRDFDSFLFIIHIRCRQSKILSHYNNAGGGGRHRFFSPEFRGGHRFFPRSLGGVIGVFFRAKM